MRSISESIKRYQRLGVLDVLLQDRTTGKNIIWATDQYAERGEAYAPTSEICAELITGANLGIIKRRADRAKADNRERTKKKAEVFTSAKIVRDMVDMADQEYYHLPPFDSSQRLFAPDNKERAKAYIHDTRLEITCGEAPYLAMRYDMGTGEEVDIASRCAIIDRKLKVALDICASQTDWTIFAVQSYLSTYGYEFQGDNLLIARINLMETFEEYREWVAEQLGGKKPRASKKGFRELANIISWNIWQMDGLKGTAPLSNTKCKIMDWEKHVVEYLDVWKEQ